MSTLRDIQPGRLRSKTVPAPAVRTAAQKTHARVYWQARAERHDRVAALYPQEENPR